jgi:hypothetical protein
MNSRLIGLDPCLLRLGSCSFGPLCKGNKKFLNGASGDEFQAEDAAYGYDEAHRGVPVGDWVVTVVVQMAAAEEEVVVAEAQAQVQAHQVDVEEDAQ